MVYTIDISNGALRRVRGLGGYFRIEVDDPSKNNLDVLSAFREYQETAPKVSKEDFVTFLNKKGIRAKILEPDYTIDDL